ncbi:monovalent cation/H+ antiporter complex subunit F [Mucisphaera sp.]|uniref:monovalent cation/H+ antiporter complex subunit F n=1 Tax=Mucisphaera sp. TaxID=2913024 RepID=UPI003D14A972
MILDLPLLIAAKTADHTNHVAPVDHITFLDPIIMVLLWIGLVAMVAGIILCFYRLLAGPQLADRVLAADALALEVVGLVLILAILTRIDAFFDTALVVAIIGFASTVAFGQYIGARALQRTENPGKEIYE